MVRERKQAEAVTNRKRVHEVLEGIATDKPARVIEISILLLIVANIIAVILETVPHIAARYEHWFRYFEWFSVTVFTAEYVLRLWSVTADPRYRHPVRGRIRFMLTPLALVDLVAILPFYLPFVMRVDLRFMRALRLIRLFRIFKIRRYSQALDAIIIALRTTRNDLLMAAAAIALLLVVASALMYFVERGHHAEQFSTIPKAMGWVIALLTPNLGVEVDPVTPAGKVLGTIIAILGFGIWALPAGILATGIGQAMRKQEATGTCPHCGKDLRSPSEQSEGDAPEG